MATLFLHELKNYLTMEAAHEISIDVKHGENLPKHIDMTFLSIPSEILIADAIDMLGKPEVEYSVLSRH